MLTLLTEITGKFKENYAFMITRAPVWYRFPPGVNPAVGRGPSANTRQTSNAEMLDARPAATSARTSVSCSSGRVTLIFLLALPDTVSMRSNAKHRHTVQTVSG